MMEQFRNDQTFT